MGRGLDHALLKDILGTNFYNVFTGIWVSTTEEAQTLTENYVPNQNDGPWVPNSLARIEYERLTQMATDPGSKTLVASPYPTRLRPVTNMDRITQSTKVCVVNLSFRAYDNRLAGSTEQDAATYAAIDASLATNNAFFASRFRDGMTADWLYNWFRPEFWIGGVNILRDLMFTQICTRNADGNPISTNLADLAVGLPVPWEFSDLYAVIDSQTSGAQASQIPQVFAQVVQYIPTTGRYVRYPVKCIADMVLVNTEIKGQ